MDNAVMNAMDAIHGSLAECYITIENNRYNFMSMTEFDSTYEVNITDVPILGQVNKGHKPAGGNITWSGTAHYNQSVMRKVALNYQKTGVMPYFDIQVTSNDKSSAAGTQTIILRNCLSETFTLAKFTVGDEILDEELSGTAESWEMPNEFTLLDGMM